MPPASKVTALRRMRAGRKRPMVRGDSLQKLLTDEGLLDWLFYAADDQGMPYPAIARQIKQRTGVSFEPDTIWKFVFATRADYQHRMAVSLAVARKMEGSVSSITEAFLDQRMLFLSAKGDLSPSETAELGRLMLQRKTLDVRRIESATNLYKVQQAGAEFVAEILKHEEKAAEMRRLAADKALTGAQFVEKIRLLVYGAEAVAKPEGIPDIRDAIETVNGKPVAEAVS